MIPYVEIHPLPIWGKFSVQPFGVLVVIGCLAGYQVGTRYVRRSGLDPYLFSRLAFWTVLPAFVFSHSLPAVIYHPDKSFGAPLWDRFWFSPMSSFGAFFGGGLGAFTFIYATKLPRKWQ